LVPLPVRRDAGSSVTRLTDAIFVALEKWTAAHGALVVSRGGDIPWPARSPDLSLCDYFLWGYLTSEVYLMKPQDNDELKNAIKNEITAITDNMVGETNWKSGRLEHRRRDGEKRMKDVLFKK
jgi:hypothetical protein